VPAKPSAAKPSAAKPSAAKPSAAKPSVAASSSSGAVPIIVTIGATSDGGPLPPEFPASAKSGSAISGSAMVVDTSSSDAPEDAPRPGRKKPNAALEVAKIAGGGVAGIAIAMLILGYGFSRGPLAPAKPKPDPEVVVNEPTEPVRVQPRPSRPNPRPRPEPRPFVPDPSAIEPHPIVEDPIDTPAAVSTEFALQSEDYDDRMVQAPKYVSVAAVASVPNTGNPTNPNPTTNPLPSAPNSTGSRDTRLPVPPDADLAKARGLVSDVFEDQFAATATPRDFQNLARSLKAKSKEAANKGAVQYVLLEESATAASEGHDVVLAGSALDEITSVFQGNVVDKREAALRKCSEEVKTTKEFELVAEYWIKLFDEAIENDRIEAAGRYVSEAGRAATRSQNTQLQLFVRNGSRVFEEIKRAFENAQANRETFLANPTDHVAAAGWGEYLCIYKNEWEEGLPLLARGENDYAIAAKGDTGSSTNATEELAVGDQWYKLGADEKRKVPQRFLMDRAASWYEKSAKKLTGFNKAKVGRKLISIRESQLNSFARTVPLLPTATFTSSIRWKRNEDRLETSSSSNSYPLRFSVESDSTYELTGNIAFATWVSPIAMDVPVGQKKRLVLSIAPPGGQSWLGSNQQPLADFITNPQVFAPNRENLISIKVIAVGPNDVAVFVRANDALVMSWTGSIASLPSSRTGVSSRIRNFSPRPTTTSYAVGIEFNAGTNNSLYLRNWHMKMLSSQIKRTK